MQKIFFFSITLIFALHISGVSCSKTGTPTEPLTESLIKNLNVSPVADSNYVEVSWNTSDKLSDVAYYIITCVSSEKKITITQRVTIADGETAVHKKIALPAGLFSISIGAVTKNNQRNIPVSTEKKVNIISGASEPTAALLHFPESTLIPDTGTGTVSITLNWNPPARNGTDHNNNTAEITTYIVYMAKGSSLTSLQYHNSWETDTTSETVFDLDPGTEYSFLVEAVNSAGLKSKSNLQSITTDVSQASAPQKPAFQSVRIMATKDDALAILLWTPPNPGKQHNGNAAEITSYAIYWKKGNTVSETDSDTVIQLDPSVLHTTISGLAFNTTYALLLVAENSIGLRTASKPQTFETGAATQAIRPDPVSGLQVVPANDVPDIELHWNKALNFGATENGSPAVFSAYNIYWKQDGNTNVSVWKINNVNTNTYTLTQSEHHLVFGQKYTITMTVENNNELESIGTEYPTETVPFTPQIPTPVSDIMPDKQHRVLNELRIQWGKNWITWTLDETGKRVPNKFKVYYAESNAYSTAEEIISNGILACDNSEALYCTLTGLSSGTAYDVVLVAINGMSSEKVSSPAMRTNMYGNNIRAVRIQLNKQDVPDRITRKVLDQFFLEAAVDRDSFPDPDVVWNSQDTSVATIDESSGFVDIVGIGESLITAHSRTDTSKLDTVLLLSEKVDISSHVLQYIYDTIYHEAGQEAVFPVNTAITTLPLHADNIIYSLETSQEGITIDPESGSITVSADLAVATYSLEVLAKPRNPLYTGSVSVSITIHVLPSRLVFKEHFPHTQELFTIGDVNDPYLFRVLGLKSITGTSVEITISDADDSTAAPVFQQDNLPLQTLPYHAIGLPAEQVLSFSALPNKIALHAVVRIHGNVYTETTRIMDKAAPGAIYTWRDLQNIQNNLKGSYTLQNDIIFPQSGDNGFDSFVPIAGDDTNLEKEGFQGTFFTGSLDGAHKKIINLYIQEESDYTGLFGCILATAPKGSQSDNPEYDPAADTVVLKNFTLENPRVHGKNFTGAVAGLVKIGILKNITLLANNNSEVSVHGTDFTGGLIGSNSGVLYGTSSGFVQGKHYTGGLAGVNTGKIFGYTTSTVKALKTSGGLVGNNAGSVVGYAEGSVQTQSYTAGGLVGYNSNSVIGFSRSNVTGDARIGGLVGNNTGNVQGYSMAVVQCTEKTAGGAIGWNQSGATATGYSLGYVFGTGSQTIGQNDGQATMYAGRTSKEIASNKLTAGAGDHVGRSESQSVTIANNHYQEIIIQETLSAPPTGSIDPAFFNFSFGTEADQWQPASVTTTHHWPILNFPLDFPNGIPLQHPQIKKPENFRE